jgi:GT2 family glycosyltransferase
MLPPATLLWLNYNSADILDITEESLAAVLQLDYPDLEIIVTDNGSTDDSAKFIENYLAKHKPRGKVKVRFLKIKTNIGWTGGVNAANSQRRPSSKYLALTHSDVIPRAGYLKTVVDFLERHRDVGAAQGVVVKLGEKDTIDSCGFMMNEGLLVSSAYTGGPVAALRKPIIVTMVEGTMPVYNLTAVNKTLGNNRELYITAGYMYYLEDAYVSLKLWANDYKCAVIPEVVASHHRMGTTAKTVTSGNRFYYLLRNRIALLYMTNSRGKLGFTTQNLRKLVVSNRTQTERRAILAATMDGIRLGFRLRRKYGCVNFYAAPFTRAALKARLFKWMH